MIIVSGEISLPNPGPQKFRQSVRRPIKWPNFRQRASGCISFATRKAPHSLVRTREPAAFFDAFFLPHFCHNFDLVFYDSDILSAELRRLRTNAYEEAMEIQPTISGDSLGPLPPIAGTF